MYSEKGDYQVEVCFSPISWPLFEKENSLVIVTDVFRATTAICAAFENGVKAIIPAESVLESEYWKSEGYIIAGERNGINLECADFGNSPFNFMQPHLRGKVICMNTTNGTRAIRLAAEKENEILIGAFSNLSAVCRYAVNREKNIVILCAGWKDRFSMEDSLFAGAAAGKIIAMGQGRFYSKCDSAIASYELWKLAAPNPLSFIDKAAHRHRLKKMGLDEVIPFCLRQDVTEKVPRYQSGRLVADNNPLQDSESGQ